MIPNIGPMEIAIVLIVAIVVLGPKKLPEFGRSLGSSMREFKDSISGDGDAEKERAAVSERVASD
jgi:sec-independent protein translocase protein TatA